MLPPDSSATDMSFLKWNLFQQYLLASHPSCVPSHTAGIQGNVAAAHLCYLLSGSGIASQPNASARICLLGVDHK